MSARSAEGQHLCPGAEGRHHHQTLAGSAGEEPAGGPGHRRQRHPAGSAVIGTNHFCLRDDQEGRSDWSKSLYLPPTPRMWH